MKSIDASFYVAADRMIREMKDEYFAEVNNYLWKLYLVAYDILRERRLLDKKSTVVTESDTNNYFDLMTKYISNYYKLKNSYKNKNGTQVFIS